MTSELEVISLWKGILFRVSMAQEWNLIREQWLCSLRGPRTSRLGGNALLWASLVAQTVENLPAMQDTQVQSLSWKDPLEKGTATHWVFLPGESHGQRQDTVQGVASGWYTRGGGLVAKSCPTLCRPMDYSLSGSSVHAIFQARILE